MVEPTPGEVQPIEPQPMDDQLEDRLFSGWDFFPFFGIFRGVLRAYNRAGFEQDLGTQSSMERATREANWYVGGILVANAVYAIACCALTYTPIIEPALQQIFYNTK